MLYYNETFGWQVLLLSCYPSLGIRWLQCNRRWSKIALFNINKELVLRFLSAKRSWREIPLVSNKINSRIYYLSKAVALECKYIIWLLCLNQIQLLLSEKCRKRNLFQRRETCLVPVNLLDANSIRLIGLTSHLPEDWNRFKRKTVIIWDQLFARKIPDV